MENKLEIIFFGTPSFALPVLESLQREFEVMAVVTAPDQKVGRKQVLTPSPVKNFAVKHALPVLTPEKITKENWDREIKENNLDKLIPDVFVTAAYGKIIPQNILDIPKYGSINVHPSLLPKYRGTSPLQYALLNEETETGVSIMKMDAEMDHGPILFSKAFEIHPDDTFETLAPRAFIEAAKVLPKCIREYVAGKLIPEEQDHEQATYTKILTKEDGFIDSYNPPTKEKIQLMIRAFYPWPCAWTKVRIKNQELRIKLLPGKLLQIEGKRPMSKKDFLNGYPELKEIIEKLI